MKEIELTKGLKTLVDDEDYEIISKFEWCATNHGKNVHYAQRRELKSLGGKCVYLHRYLMGAKKGQQVDHINGNKLDNRRSNLRICSRKENTWNKRKLKPGKYSPLKGAFLDKGRLGRPKPWFSHIIANGKCHTLGYFKTDKEAAEAYAKKSKELHGEFGCTNFKKVSA